MSERGQKKFLKIEFTNLWGADLKLFNTVPPLAWIFPLGAGRG